MKNGRGLVELVTAKILFVFYVKHARKPHPAKLGLFFWRCDIFQPLSLNSGAEEELSHTCQVKLLEQDIHLRATPENKRNFFPATEERNYCTGQRSLNLKSLLAENITNRILFLIIND